MNLDNSFQLDLSSWKLAEDQVYDFLKQGANRYACLKYGVKINCFFKDESCRPYKIYYHFELYKDDGLVYQTISGVFENTSPKLTNGDYRGHLSFLMIACLI